MDQLKKEKTKRDTSYRKGNFKCPLCTSHFAHSASLSRHRLRVHNGCHYCIQCKETIPASTTLRYHFLLLHCLTGVVTCACCNWAFTDKKTLHAHIRTVAKGGVSSLEGVLAVTGADRRRKVEEGTVFPSLTVSSSSTVPPPPPPFLPSVESIRSKDWEIPVGIDSSSPDFDLLVEELKKDSNLLTTLLISTQQEQHRLSELLNSIFPQETKPLNAPSLTPSSSISRNKKRRKSIDEVADGLMKKRLAERKD